MKSEFFGNYDEFVVEAKVQREKHNEKNKVFKVSIVAIINQNAIDAWLQDNSQSDSTDDISNFGLVVIVTDQVSSKEFDERRVNIRSNESQRFNLVVRNLCQYLKVEEVQLKKEMMSRGHIMVQ